MHFEATTATTLWFEQWHTFSGLTFYEQYVQNLQVMPLDERQIVEANDTQQENLGCARYRHSQRLALSSPGFKENLSQLAIVHSCLYGLNQCFLYLLMMAVMTFNAGFKAALLLSRQSLLNYFDVGLTPEFACDRHF
ncbi:hypothetical protein WJX77_002572 [Trebouxia sp. C0004]